MLTSSDDCPSEALSLRHDRRLSLLGSWRLSPHRGGPVPPNGQRLLAFVALHGRQSRTHIGASLWPDIDDERASGRLRSLLWRLDKDVLEMLDLSHGGIGLAPAVRDDVSELAAIAASLIKGATLPCGAAMDDDTALAVLDGPELLVGWYDEWVLPERDRANDLRVHALEALVDRFIGCGRPREALRAARVATRVDPYRESAHRATIRAFLAEGNPASALRHYERYRAFVRTELGIDRMTDEMVATIGGLAMAAPTPRAS